MADNKATCPAIFWIEIEMTDELFVTAQKMNAAGIAEGVMPQGDPVTKTSAMAVKIVDEVVGIVTFYELSPDQSAYYTPGVWVQMVYIAPEHRRRGYARRMLVALTQLADDQGLKLMLGTGTDNAAMQILARWVGFEVDHVVMRRLPAVKS